MPKISLIVSWVLVLGGWIGPPTPVAHAGARIVILTGDHESYRTASRSLQESLEKAGNRCALIEFQKDDPATRQRLAKQLTDENPELIAAGGAAAVEIAHEAMPMTPVVFFMVPNALDAAFMSPSSGATLTGVTSDIDPARQTAWISRCHPSSSRLGVLCSGRTRKTAESFKASARNVEVVIIEADKDAFPKAIDALNAGKCDGVVMLPDTKVFNAPNVERLLLWGIRDHKPVWAFSENIVKAGALGGMFCDSADVGRQAAELVLELSAGKLQPGTTLHYPRKIGCAVNVRTAKQIGIEWNLDQIGPEVIRYGEQP